MATVKQHSLREHHFNIGKLTVAAAASTLTRIALPMSGLVKRVSAVAHGPDLTVDTTMTFAIAAVAMQDASGGTATMTLPAADVAGDVSVIEFPDRPTNHCLEAEDGDIISTPGVFIFQTGGETAATEEYSFVLTIEQ